jgi:hypothetical protein
MAVDPAAGSASAAARPGAAPAPAAVPVLSATAATVVDAGGEPWLAVGAGRGDG